MKSEEIEGNPNDSTVMGTGDAVGITPHADNAAPEGALKTLKKPVRRWLIARVAPNSEKTSRDRLTALGYEVFIASQEEMRIYKNGERKKRKKIERVVITQYVFLHITERERQSIVALPFIKSFLIDRSYEERTFAAVSDAQMHELKLMLGHATDPVQFAASGFHLGDEVMALMGNFEYRGHIVRLRGDNSIFVGVRLNALGCAYMESTLDRIKLVKK